MPDQSGQPAEQRDRRRWPRILLVVFLVLAGLCAAYRYTLHRMIEAKLDEIRKQGYPVTLAELDKWYPQPPPGENAADLLTNAFALYFIDWKILNQLPLGIRPGLPPASQPLPAQMKQKIADYVSDHRSVLQILHQAATKRRCRYPVDFLEGYYSSVLPSVMKAHYCVRLLLLEALQYTDDNDLEKAVDSLVAAVALTHTLSDAPFAEALRYREWSARPTNALLEYILSRLALSDQQLERLQRAFSDEVNSSESSLPKIFAGERCQKIRYLETFMSHVRAWNGTVSRASVFYLFYRACGLLELDKLSYLNTMDRYLQASQSPLPERLRAYKAARRHAEMLLRYKIILRSILVQDYDVATDAKCIARLRCAVVGLGVERYRLAHAIQPDTLNESQVVDTFDGQPLRYKKLAKGYVVYSIGEDGKDDGGDEKKDITFMVER